MIEITSQHVCILVKNHSKIVADDVMFVFLLLFFFFFSDKLGLTCFSELKENFIGTKNNFKLAMVNELSVFKLLRFICIYYREPSLLRQQ